MKVYSFIVYKMNTGHLILLVIAAVILAYCMMRKKEYYGTQSYKYVDSGENAMYCEHNQDCEWDTARTVTLRDGSEGVCTLNGLACRSFY